MSGDELSPTENRITAGCDHLGRTCAAWFTAGEYKGRERVQTIIGRTIGGAAAGWFAGGLVYVAGPWAWGTAGAALAVSVWVAGAEQAENEHDDGDETLTPETFLELVHDLARGSNIHLNTIREHLTEEAPGHDWTGPAVRALCDTAGIPVRDGVRVPGATPPVTTGIHRADLPPLPHPLSTTPVGVVGAGQHANTNTTTTEVIGEGAAVIVKTGPSIRQEAPR